MTSLNRDILDLKNYVKNNNLRFQDIEKELPELLTSISKNFEVQMKNILDSLDKNDEQMEYLTSLTNSLENRGQRIRYKVSKDNVMACVYKSVGDSSFYHDKNKNRGWFETLNVCQDQLYLSEQQKLIQNADYTNFKVLDHWGTTLMDENLKKYKEPSNEKKTETDELTVVSDISGDEEEGE